MLIQTLGCIISSKIAFKLKSIAKMLNCFVSTDDKSNLS